MRSIPWFLPYKCSDGDAGEVLHGEVLLGRRCERRASFVTFESRGHAHRHVMLSSPDKRGLQRRRHCK